MAYLALTLMQLASDVPAAPLGTTADVLSVALTNYEERGWNFAHVVIENGETLYLFHRSFEHDPDD